MHLPHSLSRKNSVRQRPDRHLLRHRGLRMTSLCCSGLESPAGPFQRFHPYRVPRSDPLPEASVVQPVRRQCHRRLQPQPKLPCNALLQNHTLHRLPHRRPGSYLHRALQSCDFLPRTTLVRVYHVYSPFDRYTHRQQLIQRN